jgi:SNF2 family DNA or RNA helicase
MTSTGKVPEAPHLIIVPNSLMEQWIREIKVFFNKKKVDIYQLPGTEEEIEKFFLDKKSPWVMSATPPPARIVLIMHSVSHSATLSLLANCHV